MNFGLNGVGSGLSFMRVLSSISKTLGMVRQVAPIYRDLKPIFAKAPEFFSRLNSLRSNLQTSRERISLPQRLALPSPNNTIAPVPLENKGPVFFQ